MAIWRKPIQLEAVGEMSSSPDRSATADITPEVIAACRRGERAALDRVLRTHADGIERLLTRLVGPRADIEDLLQDTFVAAIDAFPRFRGDAAVKTWLHRIAVNVAHNYLRQPRHKRVLPLDEALAVAADEPVRDSLASRRNTGRLYHHLDRLDPKKRIALLLFVVESMPIAEVAALMGASVTATKSRVFWARRKLMTSLRRDRSFVEEDQ